MGEEGSMQAVRNLGEIIKTRDEKIASLEQELEKSDGMREFYQAELDHAKDVVKAKSDALDQAEKALQRMLEASEQTYGALDEIYRRMHELKNAVVEISKLKETPR